MSEEQPDLMEQFESYFNYIKDGQLSYYFSNRVFEPNETYSCAYGIHRGNLTIDYLGAADGKQFFLYSFLLTLVEKIMCSLGLTITFVSNLYDYYEKKTFLLDPIYIDDEGLEDGEMVAMEQVFMLEVLTCFKDLDAARYFSFFYLFQYEVWLCLGLSIVVNVILWRYTYGTRMSFGTAFRHMLRPLTGQPIHGFRRLLRTHSRKERRHKRIVFLMLLSIWIMVTNILIKCISSVLLNSYLKLNQKPLYNSLNEVYLDKSVKIAGRDSIRFLSAINSLFVPEIEKRFLDESEFPISPSDIEIAKTVNEVLRGKAIILDNTHGVKQKLILLEDIGGLTVAEEKLFPTLVTFYINKKVKYKNEIFKIIKTGREAGLYWHYRRLEDMKVRVRKNVLKELSSKYKKLSEKSEVSFALKLLDLWNGVFSLLVIGYSLNFLIVFIELLTQRYIEKHLNQSYSATQSRRSKTPISLISKYLHNQKKFVKRAKRLKSLQYQPKEVHRVLQSNYRLYFEKIYK